MKERRNGFTLIELLAVIAILAIIALIAVPVIMNIISKANKSAFKDSAYGIIKAGELYYSEKLLDVDGMTSTKTFEFPEAVGLDLKGSRPTSGTMKINREGKVALAISNGKYCVKKGYNDTDVTIDENIDDCVLPKEIYTNGTMTSEDECIKNGACESGTKVNVKVNEIENYDFYIIKDTGTRLTLIMNKNLVGKAVWYSSATNASGPLTAINTLEEATSGWTNIETNSYILEDDKPDPFGDTVKYEPIEVVESRARMPKYNELHELGCTDTSNNCPTWLYENLSKENTEEAPYAYWLSTSYSPTSYYGLYMNYRGNVNYYNVNIGSNTGLRPVIEISKTI